MRVRNRDGRPIDPVPFLVVDGLAFAVCFSFGPSYVAALGGGYPVGVALSAVAFVAATAVAYRRLVWTARPEHREAIPPGRRLHRILLVTALVVAALTLGAVVLVTQ